MRGQSAKDWYRLWYERFGWADSLKAYKDSGNVHCSLPKRPTVIIVELIQPVECVYSLTRHLAVTLCLRAYQVLYHWRLLSKTICPLPLDPHLFVPALLLLERIGLTVSPH